MTDSIDPNARALPKITTGIRVIVAVTGGIAAYKACELIRLLTARGADVLVVMTENAEHFVGSTTFQALSGKPVRSSLWDAAAEAAMGHIELARWAQLLVIAPATANCLAKLAAGFASDLLGTLCLATPAPVVLAPAMNQQMYAHPAVQANLAKLSTLGYLNLGVGIGAQACGDVGAGRMLEPAEILLRLDAHAGNATPPTGGLHGKRVLISAGPTLEDLDPVRFIGNRSSGKMGYAIAEAAQQLGAEVTLISGPCKLSVPAHCKVIQIRSAQQLLEHMQAHAAQADIIVAAAAVADYRPAQLSEAKLKKTGDRIQIELVKNPDVIATIAHSLRAAQKTTLLIGFAAETNDVLAHARNKLERKQLDWIAANQVSSELGMDADDNALTLISAEHEIALGRAPKTELARRFWQTLLAHSRLAQPEGT